MGFLERVFVTVIFSVIWALVSKAVLKDSKAYEMVAAIGLLVGYVGANVWFAVVGFVLLTLIPCLLLILAIFIPMHLFVNWYQSGRPAPTIRDAPVSPPKNKQDVEKRVREILNNPKIPNELKKKQIEWLRKGGTNE